MPRLCKGCHLPMATALPACERCAGDMEAAARRWAAIGDPDGRWRARSLANRQARRAARSKGNPKGQRRG